MSDREQPITLDIAPEMRLYSVTGERLYLNRDERKRFLQATTEEPPIERMFCQVLHATGCRPTEALELSAERILLDEGGIVIRSLKKKTHDSKGHKRLPQFRTVPVSDRLLEKLDLVFGLRQLQKSPESASMPLWSMSRPTAWRLIKRVMNRAGIEGKQATGKGLRHAFGVAMLTGKQPVPIHLVARALGHSSTKTTEIYLQVIGEEERQLFAAAWED